MPLKIVEQFIERYEIPDSVNIYDNISSPPAAELIERLANVAGYYSGA